MTPPCVGSKALLFPLILLSLVSFTSFAADHNDPNAINSIFSDTPANPADLYDLFGWPIEDAAGTERVVVALTFASVPETGVFDPDMLYRILFAPNPRVAPPMKGDQSYEAIRDYFQAIKDKYLRLKPSEIRVTVDGEKRAKVEFLRFPGGSFSKVIETNKSVTIEAPGGESIKVFVGGRDDAFFNDLPGFFRSINYAPQFYHVPQARTDVRELKIPKTLLELEGNDLFNFDPANPQLGQGVKKDLPPGPLTWEGNKFKKDANGNYRFVYSGKDAQAGRNVNAVILELPLSFITRNPKADRIVNTWGESWVLKASHKIPAIPDDRAPAGAWTKHPWILPSVLLALGIILFVSGLRSRSRKHDEAGSGPTRAPARSGLRILVGILLLFGGLGFGVIARLQSQLLADVVPMASDEELTKYKLVDTDGQPFADAALNERDDSKQVGANNFWLGPHLITRLGHLGWGFGPSISALGLRTSFDHDNSPVSVYKTYDLAHIVDAFKRVKKTLFQELNMPDETWKRKPGVNIPLRRPFEIFVPNVCAIDMDTTGTWPFGRRLEDQVATRFLSLFLDMSAEFKGKKYHVEILGDQSVWDQLPIEPRTPPNPVANDKPFLPQFPYLADPW
jgi:hypothetical protein